MKIYNLFKSSKTPLVDADYDGKDYSSEGYNMNSETLDNLPLVLGAKEKNVLAQLRSAGNIANKVGEYWIENKRINANIEALKIQTNASLQKHAEYMLTMQNIVARTFAERNTALSKHYQVLEKAMNSNDRELIIASLQGISSIVVKNPLEDIAKIAFALNNPSQHLELDF